MTEELLSAREVKALLEEAHNHMAEANRLIGNLYIWVQEAER